jgi:agmatinase
MKFLDLEEKYSDEKSQFCIAPIPIENNPTYGKGAEKAPEEIIKASKHLEYYDEQFDCEPFEKGIYTLPPITNFDDIEQEITKQKNKFIISLGGDHSITIKAIKALERCHDFDVIIFDAHPDMFHSWNQSQFNHRCVAQRASENHNVLIIGVRSMDKDEKDIIDANDSVNVIKAHEYCTDSLKKELDKLKKNVYVSIDVDVFDPSFIRNTGTPEPGGFFWKQLIRELRVVFSHKNVVAADIAEFAPETNFRAEAFSLAKLCYKLMALKKDL